MHRMLLCTALLFCFAAESEAQPPAAQAPEAQPTLEQLLAGVPVLSPEVPWIDQFSFSYVVLVQKELFPVRGAFRWKRGVPTQMWVATDAQRTPFLFSTDKQAMYFDIANQRLVTLDRSQPVLQLAATPEFLRYESSIEEYASQLSQKEVKIDLRSIVCAKVNNRLLRQDSHGNWRYQSTSPSGNSIMVVTFDGQAPHTVREIEVTDIASGTLGLRISDIRLNDECTQPWLRFPKTDTLPEGLPVVPIRRDRLNMGMQLAIGWNEMTENLASTHMAVDHAPLATQPDSAMKQTKQKYGPRLKDLIGIR